MATHKSAEKRARQSVKRMKRNSARTNSVRSSERKITTAIAAGDNKGANGLLAEYMSKASKASRKGVIHPKAAARKISRLATRIHKLTAKA